MKKLLTLLIFLCLLFPFSIKNSFASKSYFGKIEKGSYFYSSTDEDSKLFLLPETYFVEVFSTADDDFYYAKYQNLLGYVLKNSVVLMDGTPKTPYFSSSLRVFSPDGTGLYSLPSYSSTKLETLEYLSNDYIYYGSIEGIGIPEKTNTWYYCFSSSNNTFGYVYSVFCDSLASEKENLETFNIVSLPDFSSNQSVTDSLSKTSMIFIILGVSLPCGIVLYLLVKPSFLHDKAINLTKSRKRTRKNDYYEFDESDLN